MTTGGSEVAAHLESYRSSGTMPRPILVVLLRLTMAFTTVIVSHPISAYPVPFLGVKDQHVGPAHVRSQMARLGFYDGHKDTCLNTDVSDKSQATAMHINYAPTLARMPMRATPAIYLVRGRAVTNQLAVFGSEPGERNYAPLWHEVAVAWKSAVKPVLLLREDQILDLAKKGKLSVRQTHVVLDCPIVKVGK
jgi:hypothetical protein